MYLCRLYACVLAADFSTMVVMWRLCALLTVLLIHCTCKYCVLIHNVYEYKRLLSQRIVCCAYIIVVIVVLFERYVKFSPNYNNYHLNVTEFGKV